MTPIFPGKIALEEHFAIEETLMDSLPFVPQTHWAELKSRLLDIQDKRLRLMDQHGVERMILSLNAPAVQAIPDPHRANEIAQRANDILAAEVSKRPDRFSAFAALPLQDPELAVLELKRCVNQLGFKGALVNGFSQGSDNNSAIYYDLPQYWPFWEVVQQLDVPFYLHPRNPLATQALVYQGHGWLMGPTWAFGQETAVHALRLMGSGLFDAYPRLTIILGHLGEGLPGSMWRIDNHNAWLQAHPTYKAKKQIAEYFHTNFFLTTSGNFRTQTLIDAMLELGADKIMFSIDWPFENVEHGTDWFDSASISEADRLKIGRLNALHLFKFQNSRTSSEATPKETAYVAQ